MCTVCNESESESDDGGCYTDVIVGGEDTNKTVCDPKRGTSSPPSLPSFPHPLLPASFLPSSSTHTLFLITFIHTHTHYRLVQWWYIFVVKMLYRQVTGSTLTIDGGWTTR